MSYKAMSIKQAIEDIRRRKMYLPALQRKYVWGKQQIQLLFDSLMRDYPIGTFLFWKLRDSTARNYVFYEFLDDYDERDPYNRRMDGNFLDEEVTGVLDGQQRLSSLYIALMGSYTERTRYKRSSNSDAFVKTRLYLNLLSLPYKKNASGVIEHDEERNYEFRFLPAGDAAQCFRMKELSAQDGGDLLRKKEPVYWLQIGSVLSWIQEDDSDQKFEEILDGCADADQRESLDEQRKYVKKAIYLLREKLCKTEMINYYATTKEDLEDILKIFIRVNSGGTVLGKTDLLFSTIVATWSDGREQIEELLKEINGTANKFGFGNEFLMRCCLMLTDAPVVFKVNSFKTENVRRIQAGWGRIADAVRKTVGLLKEFGFDGSTLTSQNATLIIAYYIYHGGSLDASSKAEIHKYLLHALLNYVYGSSQDQVLNALRNGLRQPSGVGGASWRLKEKDFSFDQLLKVPLPGRNALTVTDDDIERFLDSKKGPDAFLVLSLLYPGLRHQDEAFHQDHIHPYSRFNSDEFSKLSLGEDEQDVWLKLRDTVPNLQLLNGRLNESKNDKTLVAWMNEKPVDDRAVFASSNYYPQGVGFEFANFPEFYQMRMARLAMVLRGRLAINNVVPAGVVESVDGDDAGDDE